MQHNGVIGRCSVVGLRVQQLMLFKIAHILKDQAGILLFFQTNPRLKVIFSLLCNCLTSLKLYNATRKVT